MNLPCFVRCPGREVQSPGIFVDAGTATHRSFCTGSKATMLSPANADRGVASVSTAAAATARRASRRLTSAAPSDALHRVTWQARTLRSVVFEARSAAARETAQPSWVADVDMGSWRACDGCKGTRVRFHARVT